MATATSCAVASAATAALEAVTGFERETTRIDRIVRGLLDYARPKRPAPTPIDINESIRHVVDLLNDRGAASRLAPPRAGERIAPCTESDTTSSRRS
jgi:nitrogen fixation/metabolism regulation signal transduction histidine kinase